MIFADKLINEYLELEKENSRRIAFGVSLCILSPVLLIVLAGLAECGIIGISAEAASGIGISVILQSCSIILVSSINILRRPGHCPGPDGAPSAAPA